jgi:hypothetical protein
MEPYGSLSSSQKLNLFPILNHKIHLHFPILLFKIHCSIILSMHRSYKWSLSSTFCHQNLYAFSSSTIMMPRPTHPRGSDAANSFWEEVKITKSPIKQLPSASYQFLPLAFTHTPQQPVLVRWLSDSVLAWI